MSFSQKMIDDVWEKAEKPIFSSDISVEEKYKWRKDQCGAWICYQEYGKRNTKYGWEIDHITPESKGGKSILSNLRPLHWKNNASKSDGKLITVVTSNGRENVDVS